MLNAAECSIKMRRLLFGYTFLLSNIVALFRNKFTLQLQIDTQWMSIALVAPEDTSGVTKARDANMKDTDEASRVFATQLLATGSAFRIGMT